MKQVWPLLLTGVIGFVIGLLIGGRMAVSQKIVPSPVLKDFTFANFIADVSSSEWTVVEDKAYDTLPPLSLSPRIARRIVAQTSLENSDQNEFATRFQRAAEEWITSCGAMIKGQQDAQRVVAKAVTDGEVRALIDLPRRYYAVGNVNGVADFGCVAHSGSVTIIISIVEGF